MAVITLTARAQVTHSTEVTEIVPGQTTTVTEVVPPAPTVVAPAEPVTSTTVTEVVPAPRATAVTPQLDPVVVRRQLSVTPRAITLTPEQRTSLNRTVTVETRTEPVRRVYNLEREVVIVEVEGKSLELPYVTVPVLFVVDTAELLDAESRVALEQTGSVINEIVQTEPSALFDVEGHTSTEGTAEHNSQLSVERAKRVHLELTQRYGVPPTALTAHGYGENFAVYPEGSEAQLQKDRRVLVVRTR